MSGPAWFAVDWGTSNLRVWGLRDDDSVAFSTEASQGMSKLSPTDYPAVLTALIGDHLAPQGESVDVVICGMAGARQGWREAAYLETPADLDTLPNAAVAPPMPPSRLRPRIVPGVCQRGDAADVMRGEETQLLGLLALVPAFEGVVCLPGTHAKWATLERRRVTRFATAMTGELFDLLRTHSVLRHSFAGDRDEGDEEAGLHEGLAQGIAAPERLTASLFRVRAGALLSGKPAGWCEGFLSGLLIGSEIGAQRRLFAGSDIALIGSAAVVARYEAGLAMAGAKVRRIDAAAATLAGLCAIHAAGR